MTKLTSRDRSILWSCGVSQVLTTSQILRWHFGSTSLRNVQKRLQKLVEAGFLKVIETRVCTDNLVLLGREGQAELQKTGWKVELKQEAPKDRSGRCQASARAVDGRPAAGVVDPARSHPGSPRACQIASHAGRPARRVAAADSRAALPPRLSAPPRYWSADRQRSRVAGKLGVASDQKHIPCSFRLATEAETERR